MSWWKLSPLFRHCFGYRGVETEIRRHHQTATDKDRDPLILYPEDDQNGYYIPRTLKPLYREGRYACISETHKNTFDFTYEFAEDVQEEFFEKTIVVEFPMPYLHTLYNVDISITSDNPHQEIECNTQLIFDDYTLSKEVSVPDEVAYSEDQMDDTTMEIKETCKEFKKDNQIILSNSRWFRLVNPPHMDFDSFQRQAFYFVIKDHVLVDTTMTIPKVEDGQTMYVEVRGVLIDKSFWLADEILSRINSHPVEDPDGERVETEHYIIRNCGAFHNRDGLFVANEVYNVFFAGIMKDYLTDSRMIKYIKVMSIVLRIPNTTVGVTIEYNTVKCNQGLFVKYINGTQKLNKQV